MITDGSCSSALLPPAFIMFCENEGAAGRMASLAMKAGSTRLIHVECPLQSPVRNHGRRLCLTATTAGDLAGWLGDLYTFYGDWQRAGGPASKFVKGNLGKETEDDLSRSTG